MGKKRIFTVGFELPGDDFEYIPFYSDQTLLDADIVLFEPTLGDYESVESYSGRSLLTESSSFRTKERLNHWYSEIVDAVNAGKLVVIYLTKPQVCFRHTGEKQYAGTGRSRCTTNIVTEVSSYEAVPKVRSVKAKSGKDVRLEMDATYIAPYWKEFSSWSPYQAEIEGDFTKILLKARTGNRTVGAAFHAKTGILLFLPPLQYDEEKFTKYDGKTGDYEWTKEAQIFGAKLKTSLVNLAETLGKSRQITPPPTWTANSKYRFTKESELEKQISLITSNIVRLQDEKSQLRIELLNAGGLRRLLYEQGKQLEEAILEALVLFGFEATPYADGESQFDAVFNSPEGRCLGEAEGKDNKAISVDKISQLERNLQEDFARDEIDDYAKGVLFGNSYRLIPVTKRGDFFTIKCVSAAKRGSIALVRTPDLFAPAKYLKENSPDDQYAKQCRDAIFKSVGTVVVFPDPPINEEDILTQDDVKQELKYKNV